jgi:hypothetical protein
MSDAAETIMPAEQRGRATPLAGAALALVLLLPEPRAALEGTMVRHMLVQLPLLLLAGVALASGMTRAQRDAIASFNARGAAGILLALVLGACVMVPRVLDAAVASVASDALKALCLGVAGVALSVSWRAAGLAGQAFVVGNVCWMLAAVGLLLHDTPSRICASYLEGDQQRAGLGLVMMAVLIGLIWVSRIRRNSYFFAANKDANWP